MSNDSLAAGPGASFVRGRAWRQVHSRWVAFGRAGAAGLIALELTLFLIAIPSRYRQLVDLAVGAGVVVVRPVGYALTVLGLEVTIVASLATVAGLIVWQRTWSPAALLFASVFVGYAVWVTLTLDALPFGTTWPVGSGVQASGQLLAVLFFFTFPDGRFVPAWTRLVAVLWALYALAWAVAPDSSISLIDPFSATVPAAALLLFGGWGVGLAAQYARYRSDADEEQRRQTKVVMLVIAAACVGYAAVYVPGILIEGGRARTLYDLYSTPIFWLLALPIPVALVAAMLRHRLFGASVVVVRAILFGTLALFITAVYVAIVVGIGALFRGTARPSLGLSLVATAAIAVAFQPMRVRAQRFANQVVYGRRVSPYEVLAEFATYVGETSATEDLLPIMARNLGEGIGADSADVWLRTGDLLQVRAVWPEGSAPHGDAIQIDRADVGPPGVSAFLPVRDHGELLGGLSIRMPVGEELGAGGAVLADQLASQAGLVLRNVRLTDDLTRSLEELQASRVRLVAAADRERQRLERNIHDGAQQQLVALSIRAGLIKSQIAVDPEAAARALLELQEQIQDAIADLRDLARGIFPPLLIDEGLVAALGAQVRKALLPVELAAEGVGRYAQEVEVAVYFCVLEALQNVGKYAEAARAWVSLRGEPGRLSFEIRDDGKGFDPATTPMGLGFSSMADRLSALGGEVRVESRPRGGTTVTGWTPA